MNSKEVGLYQNQIADFRKDFWGGMDDERDFRIPMVDIGQPSSVDKKVGEFNFNHGHSAPSLQEVKLLVPSKRRVLFGKTKTSPKLCWSSNYHNPDPAVTTPYSEKCSVCPMSAWGSNEQKEGYRQGAQYYSNTDKPACSETFSFIMADHKNMPFGITFSSSAIKVVKERLLSRLRFEFGEYPPPFVSFTMSLSGGDSNKGNYYIPAFTDFKVTPSEQHDDLMSLYRQLSKTASEVLSREYDEMEAKRVSDDIPF